MIRVVSFDALINHLYRDDEQHDRKEAGLTPIADDFSGRMKELESEGDQKIKPFAVEMVAEDGSDFVQSFLLGETYRTAKGVNVLKLHTVATAPECRRIGYARILVKCALEGDFDHGKLDLVLGSVSAKNEAGVALLKSLGFDIKRWRASLEM